jgi:hypothetical protein
MYKRIESTTTAILQMALNIGEVHGLQMPEKTGLLRRFD